MREAHRMTKERHGGSMAGLMGVQSEGTIRVLMGAQGEVFMGHDEGAS